MSRPKLDIVLASASPRRKELLMQVGVRAEVIVPNITEIPKAGETPAAYIERNAREKSLAVKTLLEKRHRHDLVIISADTIVLCEGKVLEKPTSQEDARRMLRTLSDREHEVLTAYCLTAMDGSDPHVRRVQSTVHFRELDPREIEAYVLNGEPMDKAGAYGAQGLGSAFIARIDGSYTNVVGLPLFEVLEDLKMHYHWQPF